MPDRRAGFTLLELIISLTIIAIIVVVIQNGFHICLRAWEKGESAVDKQQRHRLVLELIQRQLSSSSDFPAPANREVGEDGDAAFKGTESSMEFSSRISLVPGTPSEMVRVWYRIETADDGGKSLSFTEERFFAPPVSVQDRPVEAQWHVLLSGIKEVSFEYLPSLASDTQTDEGSFWQPSWESNQKRALPLAVRMGFQADEKTPPLYLVVPVGKGNGN